MFHCPACYGTNHGTPCPHGCDNTPTYGRYNESHSQYPSYGSYGYGTPQHQGYSPYGYGKQASTPPATMPQSTACPRHWGDGATGADYLGNSVGYNNMPWGDDTRGGEYLGNSAGYKHIQARLDDLRSRARQGLAALDKLDNNPHWRPEDTARPRHWGDGTNGQESLGGSAGYNHGQARLDHSRPRVTHALEPNNNPHWQPQATNQLALYDDNDMARGNSESDHPDGYRHGYWMTQPASRQPATMHQQTAGTRSWGDGNPHWQPQETAPALYDCYGTEEDDDTSEYSRGASVSVPVSFAIPPIPPHKSGMLFHSIGETTPKVLNTVETPERYQQVTVTQEDRLTRQRISAALYNRGTGSDSSIVEHQANMMPATVSQTREPIQPVAATITASTIKLQSDQPNKPAPVTDTAALPVNTAPQPAPEFAPPEQQPSSPPKFNDNTGGNHTASVATSCPAHTEYPSTMLLEKSVSEAPRNATASSSVELPQVAVNHTATMLVIQPHLIPDDMSTQSKTPTVAHQPCDSDSDSMSLYSVPFDEPPMSKSKRKTTVINSNTEGALDGEPTKPAVTDTAASAQPRFEDPTQAVAVTDTATNDKLLHDEPIMLSAVPDTAAHPVNAAVADPQPTAELAPEPPLSKPPKFDDNTGGIQTAPATTSRTTHVECPSTTLVEPSVSKAPCSAEAMSSGELLKVETNPTALQPSSPFLYGLESAALRLNPAKDSRTTHSNQHMSAVHTGQALAAILLGFVQQCVTANNRLVSPAWDFV